MHRYVNVRERLRQDAEREMEDWVDRYCCRGMGFSWIECLAIADSALEKKRLRQVEKLRDSEAGRLEARALEIEPPVT